jgi:hypothetical protein
VICGILVRSQVPGLGFAGERVDELQVGAWIVISASLRCSIKFATARPPVPSDPC